MQLHNIQPKTKRASKKRVGRGGKRGTYSGRGVKGQRSRAGHNIRPGLRDLLISIPKLRGYRNKPTGKKYVTVDIARIAQLTEPTITKEVLVENGLIRPRENAKITGGSEDKVKKEIVGIAVTKSARAII
jgi:large subunit ribosomal protein L15